MQITKGPKSKTKAKNKKSFIPIIIGAAVVILIGVILVIVLGNKKEKKPYEQVVREQKAADVESCKTIQTAVYNVMGDEKIFGLLYDGGNGSIITITPGVSTKDGGGVSLSVSGEWEETTRKEIASYIGEKTPKFKYTEYNPTSYRVEVAPDCSVRVYIVADKEYQILPELCQEYQ